MREDDLSVRRLLAGVTAGMLLSMAAVTAFFYFLTSEAVVIAAGVFFAACGLCWLLLLTHLYGRKLSMFTSGLCRTLDEMMSGNLSGMADSGDSETISSRIHHQLSRLYQAMGENRRRVEQEQRELQELVSDISHQVKTPVSNIKMVTETLLDRQMSAGERREFLTGIRSQTEKLDFLINVPVWKGHCQTKITCALKNLKGLIPNSEKRRFHSLGLHKPIAHLNGGIRQDFIVVDHICGDLDFEDGGNPVVCDQILTARDPVLCDAYVCEKMHYRQEEVPYIQLAQSLGVGSADLTTLSVQECQTGREDRELPRERKIVHVQDAVEEVESCSACYGYLIPALDQLREEGFLEKLKEKICIGQGFRGKKGNLGIGQCTREFTHSLEGCPPTENQIYEFLKAYILEKDKEEIQCQKDQKKQ